MIELALFASTFVTVFALGLQSLNVNGGHFVAAFFTSFLIGAGNLVVLKIVPTASMPEMLAYLAGGPLGIVTSMVVHRHTIGRRWLPGSAEHRRQQHAQHAADAYRNALEKLAPKK